MIGMLHTNARNVMITWLIRYIRKKRQLDDLYDLFDALKEYIHEQDIKMEAKIETLTEHLQTIDYKMGTG